MIRMLNTPFIINPKEYASNPENEGKVALFDMCQSQVIAEGDGSDDWLNLETIREQKQNTGDYRIVIVPRNDPRIVSLSY